MSVLKLLIGIIWRFAGMCFRGVIWANRQVIRAIPVVVACVAATFALAAGVVLVLVLLHVTSVQATFGTGTTIAILLGSAGLLVSSMGVLIAALRYIDDRNMRPKGPGRSGEEHLVIPPMRQDQNRRGG